MTTLREAAQQALEALLDDCLVQVGPHSWERRSDLAITALRAALAEPPTNQCGETCERAKLCAVCARGLAEPVQETVQEPQLKRIHPLDMPLEVFVEDLSTRPRNIINAEIWYFTHLGDKYIKPPLTVRHLLMFSRKELRKWPNLGKRSLNEIEEMLRNRGLQLWDEHDERSLRLLREHPTYFRAALAEPVQEPVAWMVYTPDGKSVCVTDNPADFTETHRALPFYTTPPQRKPLTEEEIGNAANSVKWSQQYHVDFARAIEAAHGIKE